MIYNVILPLFILSAIYVFAIFGLIVILSKMGVSSKRRIFLSFLVFGTATGFLVAWTWPKDIGVLINMYTVFLGDEVYKLSILYLGEPHSPQAHYTIPWILRIPQVYPIISIIFWSLLGLLIQSICNRKKKQDLLTSSNILMYVSFIHSFYRSIL